MRKNHFAKDEVGVKLTSPKRLSLIAVSDDVSDAVLRATASIADGK